MQSIGTIVTESVGKQNAVKGTIVTESVGKPCKAVARQGEASKAQQLRIARWSVRLSSGDVERQIMCLHTKDTVLNWN